MSLGFQSATPYPLYDGHTIADLSGNANGRLDPGDTVVLDVVLRNYGPEATNVSATLTSGDANIEVDWSRQ